MPDGAAPRVLLINGSRQEIDRRTGRLHVLTFGEYTVELSQSGHGEEQRFRDATEMSIGELLHPGDRPCRSATAASCGRRRIGGWRRR